MNMNRRKSLLSLLVLFAMVTNGCSMTSKEEHNPDVDLIQNQTMDTSDETPIEEPSDEELIEAEIDEWIATHSLDEKICQLFIITPEALTGYGTVTAAGDATEEKIEEYPVGGIIYFKDNLETPDQTREMLSNTKHFYDDHGFLTPFLVTDEEGGKVARIENNLNFDLDNVGSMRDIGDTGDVQAASEVGTTLGSYLYDIGFNMDMAPVADVLTNPKNEVIGNRSFGTDSELVADMAIAEANAMSTEGVVPVYKHFPGHGATTGDSHDGFVSVEKTLEELQEAELIPFQRAIDQDADVIMVGHISVPNITGNNEPSSLSEYMISDVLRNQMGYDGIVITDAMNMGAIKDNYGSGEMAVKAVHAGVDIILMPADFHTAYDAILDAVQSGEISEERIDESLRRILRVKLRMEE